jgi:mono/diheme cytochrome c family protein
MKVLRWVGRILLGLLGLLIVAAAAVYLASNTQLNKTITVPQEQIAIPTDPARIEHGQHLVVALAKCVDCHGPNLAGGVFLDVPPFRVVAPNLTRGQGGVGGQLSDADFVRAIRHGVAPDGRPLLVMPADEYNNLSEADLADIIAYVKSVPPVDNQLPANDIRPLGRALLVAGQLLPFPADQIDHSAAFPAPIQPAVTAEYGHYLAATGGCIGCHRSDLTGGPIAGLPPETPPAANITPAGIGNWSDTDFFRALREGKRPDGSQIRPPMPVEATAKMTDDEIKALLMYLRTVPAKQASSR